MPTYSLNAVNCPAVQVPVAFLALAMEASIRAEQMIHGLTYTVAEKFGINAAHLDNVGMSGGVWAHAIVYGGDLTAGTGLLCNISALGAGIGASPTEADAQSVALVNDSDNYMWVLQDGSPSLVQDAATAPVGAVAYLGMVPVVAGVQGTPDYSGRVENRGGTLYRRTGDAGVPGDTPPAGLLLFTQTAGGYYLWTGSAYVSVPNLTAAQTWTQKQTFSGEIEVDGALNHDGSTVGFYGVAPVARPAALVQTYATADRTLGAYTPDAENVAYTGATDGEAKLADLNALRVAVENLRAFAEDLAQHHNALVDDLQLQGLEQ